MDTNALMYTSYLLSSSKVGMDAAYALIFIACAVGVYLTIVFRAGEDIPRKDIDMIFFLIIGVSSIIWILSKVLPAFA